MPYTSSHVPPNKNHFTPLSEAASRTRKDTTYLKVWLQKHTITTGRAHRKELGNLTRRVQSQVEGWEKAARSKAGASWLQPQLPATAPLWELSSQFVALTTSLPRYTAHGMQPGQEVQGSRSHPRFSPTAARQRAMRCSTCTGHKLSQAVASVACMLTTTTASGCKLLAFIGS